jgi:hypothetical protein
MTPRPRARQVAALGGTALVLSGLVIIWLARATVTVTIYVSELGATGQPTAAAFEIALLCIACGGLLIAASSRELRSRVAWLAVWLPATSLAVGSACFVAASQVTCTAGCPVPILDPTSAPQDLIHTVLAVFGFAAACLAMLQVGFVPNVPTLSRVSIASCVAVATITITGGLLAILRFDSSIGAWLEFAGMTIAIGWVAAFGVLLAVAHPSARAAVVSDPSGDLVGTLQDR